MFVPAEHEIDDSAVFWVFCIVDSGKLIYVDICHTLFDGYIYTLFNSFLYVDPN